MWIKASVRFNEKTKGTVWDADEKDAKKWIKMGLAKKTDKPKVADKPPEDKTAKSSEINTK